jgi:hypothetical protein
MGFAPTGKRRLCTAHTQPGHSSTDSFWRIVLKKSFRRLRRREARVGKLPQFSYGGGLELNGRAPLPTT